MIDSPGFEYSSRTGIDRFPIPGVKHHLKELHYNLEGQTQMMPFLMFGGSLVTKRLRTIERFSLTIRGPEAFFEIGLLCACLTLITLSVI